jgi:hypothetical protein
MDIQSAALNELFVLYPVIIQGWISPVQPAGLAHGGIPKLLYDGQPNGLECLVDPWTEVRAWTLAVDDRVDLFINDNPKPVGGKTIKPGEEALRILLLVPHGHLREGVNRIHYKVTRPSGGSEPSRDLNVLYHLLSPGESLPENMTLQIPDDVRENGVDAARAAAGVVFGFDYTYRRAYDRIRLTLGLVDVYRVVAPDEAGTGLPVITQTLFTDTFRQVGDNPSTPVKFAVTDQLGNFVQSLTERIDVHVDRVVLPAPTITSVKGSPSDVEIPEGTTTVETAVTLTGTASKGQKVEIFDGTVTKGIATADANTGIWKLPVTGLAVSPTVHSFTAKAKYANEPVSTPPRTFTVVASATPVITAVKDTKNVVIPQGGTTADTSVTLEGTASKGLTVEIFDGTASKGTATADANTGIWKLPVTGLAVSPTAHSFTAKAKYANEPVSTPPRTFTVVASATPVITAVKDTKNVVIPQGGTTADTSVTLEGTASKGLTVEIFDGTASKGTATADANTGIWKLPVTGLAVSPTAHSFTAKAKYANEPVSTPPRTFTVVPALGLDPSPVTLNGYCFSIVGTTLGWEFSGTDKTGTYTDRVPTGGTPPYTYTSANPAVAAVDSRGRVRSTGNGSTRITATDRGLNTASYEVRVSNVRHLQHQPTPGYAQAVAAWVTAQGATTLTTSHHADLARFAAPGGANLAYWLGPPVVQVNPRAVNCALLAMYPPPNPPRVITTGWEDTPLQGLAIKRNDIAADQ